MTNKEAITKLTNILNDDTYSWHPSHAEALEMAVEALKANLVNESGGLVKDSQGDCISRQAAIDALCKAGCGSGYCGISCEEYKAIENLPPAQPKIIRCKDCKHWDGADTCDVIDAPVWDNDFCSMAERRSDE